MARIRNMLRKPKILFFLIILVSVVLIKNIIKFDSRHVLIEYEEQKTEYPNSMWLQRDEITTFLDLQGHDWTVRNENSSILVPATVPGGIYTDLENAGVLKTPVYYRFNDQKYKWVGRENWIYEKTFFVDSKFKEFENVVIHFEGLDTVADILLNNHRIGGAENMFVRLELRLIK